MEVLAAVPAPLRRAAPWSIVPLAWVASALFLPQGAPVGVVLSGAILGTASALTAVGLVLLYRANRIINFAYGAMGGVLGLTAIRTFIIWHWNYGAVLVGGVLLGIAIGILTEVLVIRRFEKSSRLILTVATLGLTQLFGGFELLIPGWIFDEKAVTLGGFDTPLTRYNFSIGPTIVNGNHLLIIVVAPVVVAALAWFLTRTPAGMAIRAASENAERARLLGIPVRRINTLVWAIAGGLATMTFLLKAPFAGTTPSAGAGPALLIPALAAAVIARMESLPVACGSAVVLGAVDAVVRWNVSRTPSVVDVVMFAIILGALLFQKRTSSRARDNEASWQGNAAARRVPRAVAATLEWRTLTGVAVVGLAALAVCVPFFADLSLVNTFTTAIIWAAVAVSLVVLTGWNGQISLGQFALVGVGSITAGNLISRWNVDLFVSLLAALLVTGFIALLLGLPALRIQGPFLAVVTLAFAVMLDSFILNPNVFPWLIPQTVDRPVLLQRWPLETVRNLYWFALAILAVIVVIARGVRRSRSGRLLLAGRDNFKAAEAMSVPSRWTALQGFVLSGCIAGLAGGVHVLLNHGARVNSYLPSDSIDIFSMSTIGGLGSIGGAITGAFGMRTAVDQVPAGVRLLVTGVGLLIVLMAIPGGVAGLASSLRDRLVVAIAKRRGIALGGLDKLVADDSSASPTALQPALAAVPAPAMSTRDIDVSYGALQVLFGVNLDVGEGEIVALLGTNGAGKSTLLKAACGLLPYKGSVRLGGEDITGVSTEELVRRGVALMPGGKSVFPTLTVDEHLTLAAWTFRHDHDRITADTNEVLRVFPSLVPRRHTMAGDLSGGEQQQLALAQTLLLRPKVLLIDELSLGLAPTIVAQLLEVVRLLNAAGVSIVVVEQSVNVALSLAERAVFMEKGQVRFEGPTRDLLERPDILRSVFLHGAGAVHDDEADAEPSEGEATVPARISIAEVARPVARGGESATRRGPVLEVRGLVKRFGGITAVDTVDLDITPATVVGLVGQNGAGKRTILDCLSGFHQIDGGRVFLRGVDITSWAPYERARGGMGRSFQEARLYPSLSVEETISVACERHVASRSMLADATRQPASFESELTTRRRVAELVDLLGLGDHREKSISELSTGTRRIVELGCLLAEEPHVLLLDEPSAGVAQRETEALGPLLLQIRDHTGAALVVIEHDMPLLSSICDEMVALELGGVIARGTPQEVLADDKVIASYLGTDAAAINRSGVGSVA